MAAALVAAGCGGGIEYKSDRGRTRSDRRLERISRQPMVKTVARWTVPAEMIGGRSVEGLQIATAHYRIYTTLQDELILQQVPFFLESAFGSYAEMLGQTIRSEKKLVVYFWDTREQWEDFTRYWAGPNATVYLNISAGAYYLRGVCVTYHIRRDANFSVLAHEGWHQFSHQLFKYRLPSWLDEGLATNFESYTWSQGKVTFDPKKNGSRLFALKRALVGNTLMKLSSLLVLDPGRVIGHHSASPEDSRANPQMAAFYGQVYALVRFMREYNYGEYLVGFRKLLNDARLGRWPLDAVTAKRAQEHKEYMRTRHWNDTVGPMIFRHYLAPTTHELDPAYETFCQRILSRISFKKNR